MKRNSHGFAGYHSESGFAPIIIILLVLALVGVAYYFGTLKNKNNFTSMIPTSSPPIHVQLPINPTNQPEPTPWGKISTSSNGWKTFTSSYGYKFDFPGNWEMVKQDTVPGYIKFTYYESGEKYTFSTESGGRGGPEGDITNEKLILDNYQFNRRTWAKSGTPFLISVMPDSENPPPSGVQIFDHIEFTIPAANNSKYLKLFDQILSTFKFTK